MRQPFPKTKPLSRADIQRVGAAAVPPGTQLATQALADFQNGDLRNAVRNANMAGFDILTHGVIPNHIDWDQHPKGAEAMTPAWGPMREGIADLDDGDYVGAAINTGLAAADAFGARAAVGTALAERAVNRRLAQAAANNRGAPARDPRNWKRVRTAMGKVDLLEKGQPGHHWLIPQNGWGKTVPNALKNRPWNIMPMADQKAHNALHRLKDPLEQFLKGTPTGLKALLAEPALRYERSGDAGDE